jgi:hypothetical protein
MCKICFFFSTKEKLIRGAKPQYKQDVQNKIPRTLCFVVDVLSQDTVV